MRAGEAQAPRRDGEAWEVDVVRPNGSLVQVTLGDRLELRQFDEELGPAGTSAPDPRANQSVTAEVSETSAL